MKFNHSGDQLWEREFGGAGGDQSHSVAVDNLGNVFITGTGVVNGLGFGSYDSYIIKIDQYGTEQWSRQIGTSAWDYGHGVDTDGDGNVFITGYTRGNLGGVNAGGNDAYLVKYDQSGTELWSRQVGTAESDTARSVAVDSAGNAYITGSTYTDHA